MREGTPVFVFSLVVGNPDEALKYLEDHNILTKEAAQDTLGALPIADISLTIATHDLKPEVEDDKMFLTAESIKTNRELQMGLAINVLIRVPKTCLGSEKSKGAMLCGYLQQWLNPGAYLLIVGRITFADGLPSGLQLSVTLGQIQLAEGLRLEAASLFISIGGTNNKLGVSAQLAVTVSENTILQFKGTLEMGVKDFSPYLSLKFESLGTWKHPFGLQWISVGNMLLTAELKGTGVAVTMGGDFWLGKTCTVPTNSPIDPLASVDVDASTGLIAAEAARSTPSPLESCMSGRIVGVDSKF